MKKLFLLFLPFMLFALSTKNIFAVSWMNGFCEVNKKAVCKHRSDYSYENFTIHGLWPKHKNYCSYKKMDLDREFLRFLNVYMPGADGWFSKHEWKKHGTCFGSDAKSYFEVQVKLLKELNHSLIRRYFVSHRGEVITLQRVRNLFKKEFSSPRKVQMICKRGYVVELRMSLGGNPFKHNLKYLLQHGDDMIGVRQCQRGIIE